MLYILTSYKKYLIMVMVSTLVVNIGWWLLTKSLKYLVLTTLYIIL
jgi:hypothetical protein